MEVVRITKEFSFEMAHSLYGHSGPCRNIHGHSYHLSVTVKGKPVKDQSLPQNGIVMDFGEIQSIAAKLIDEFDHALVINANSPHNELKDNKLFSDNIILFPDQPTCENLILHFAGKIKEVLPDNINLHCLKLRETSSSYVEWYAEDN
ncbi:MAG: 6-carboxytetrahydropterin synthase [Bacteroidota bacterium]